MVSVKYLMIAGLLAAQPSFADDNTFSACMEKSGGVTNSMVDCIGQETKSQDVRLNKAYKEVMASVSSERKKQLQDAQRLWLKYREANCDFYYDPEGGTIARVNANNCFLSTTEARAKELEGFNQEN
ncbi:MAG: hypothetical protein RI893_66 [Pseudomonadota bacterium]|jgi:uncharacterized protein YecT (DUF1311 family)